MPSECRRHWSDLLSAPAEDPSTGSTNPSGNDALDESLLKSTILHVNRMKLS